MMENNNAIRVIASQISIFRGDKVSNLSIDIEVHERFLTPDQEIPKYCLTAKLEKLDESYSLLLKKGLDTIDVMLLMPPSLRQSWAGKLRRTLKPVSRKPLTGFWKMKTGGNLWLNSL